MKTLNSTNLKLPKKQSSLLIAALFLSASVTRAQVLVSQDFSSGNVQIPPSGWTNNDLGGSSSTQIWNFNNPGNHVFPVGNPGFSGQFAIIDSDHEGDTESQNATLESPAFDASNTSLNYKLEYDDSYEDLFDIATVEVWNGTAWTVVYTEPTSPSGGDMQPNPPVHRTINITAATGNSAVAKVRFHYVAAYALWWAIDNVKISAFACVSPTATAGTVSDCANNQYSVAVNVTNLGTATSISFSDGTNTYFANSDSTGTYPVGPFTSGISQNITIIHDQDALCNVNLAPIVAYCPPVNDECSGAVTLTAGATCTPTAGYTESASVSVATPSSCQGINNGDVWYKFQAAETEQVISMNSVSSISGATAYKWGIEYFSGADCNSLTSQGCVLGVENLGTTPASLYASGLTVGQTYYVKVWADSAYDASYVPMANGIAFNICVTSVPVPTCATLTAPLDASTTGVFPQLTWNAAAYATSYNVYLDQNATPTTMVANVTGTSYTPTVALSQSTTYHWYVEPVGAAGTAVGCVANTIAFTTVAPPANDEPTNAIALTMDATCSGSPYTNANANHNPNEPFPNCSMLNQGEHSVWFSFVAPTSGAVKITTDINPQGTLTDTKIGLFSATNVSDYGTFTQIACDNDNGTAQAGYNSTIFATNLVGGQTYYVEVDGSDATSTGTFCLQVAELNSSMLSASGSCVDAQSFSPVGTNSSYTGWVTIVDVNGNLIATVRNANGGAPSNYTASVNVSSTNRQDAAGRYYLNRNFRISNSTISTPVDVRLFFTAAEMAALTGVTTGATTLSNLNLTKQSGNICNANYVEGNGTSSLVTQSSNGSVNGVNWIQFTTSSFSNFYLMGGSTPLSIVIKSIEATNKGAVNVIDWTTVRESKGDRMELERSADGKNFTAIAKIAANEKPSDYSYTDQMPFNGVNYYRLKLVDAENQSFYSEIVEATAKGTKGFDVMAYPNPAASTVTVRAFGSSNGVITLSDLSGREVYHTTINGNEATIDLGNLSNGVYFLKYADDVQSKTIKLSKQ